MGVGGRDRDALDTRIFLFFFLLGDFFLVSFYLCCCFSFFLLYFFLSMFSYVLCFIFIVSYFLSNILSQFLISVFLPISLKQKFLLYKRVVLRSGLVEVYCHSSILANGSCGSLKLQSASRRLTVSEWA